MNVLLISQAYPPYPVVGALRARKLADALRLQGHRVVVITERLAEDRAELREDAPGFQVQTVVVGLQYRLRFVALRDRLSAIFKRRQGDDVARSNERNAGASAESPQTAPNDNFLRRLILALLWFPDDEQRFIRPAYRAARARLRNEHFDVIYTTAPPFSAHLVGLLLRSSTGVHWVAEFRDPWTDQRENGRPNRVAIIEMAHRWLERSCLQKADQVVAVTEGAREGLARKLPEASRHKFLLALNGIDALSPKSSANRGQPFRIVYAGSFYANRDPRPFLLGLSNVMRRRNLDAADVAVEFIGDCRRREDESVERMVVENGLESVVHFHDWMPFADAQTMMSCADLLFLIARSQPLQVPNKLFDYLGMRKPILAMVDAGGESERMLLRVGGHHVVSCRSDEEADIPALELALESALDGLSGSPMGHDRERILEEWLAPRQMGQLVRAITP